MMRVLMLAACGFLSCGVLVAQEKQKPDAPRKDEVYETVDVWVAEVVTSLLGENRQLGVFHSKAEADAAAKKWDDANDAKGKDKSFATTNVREATVQVPIRKSSGADKSNLPGKIEILPPRPFVDPGVAKRGDKKVPGLNGKKVPGQIADVNVTFEFGEGGKLEITGDAIGSGKWEQDGASIKMETKVATYRGRVSEPGVAGLRFWKDNSKPLAQWSIDLRVQKNAVAPKEKGLTGKWRFPEAYSDGRVEVFQFNSDNTGSRSYVKPSTEQSDLGANFTWKLDGDFVRIKRTEGGADTWDTLDKEYKDGVLTGYKRGEK